MSALRKILLGVVLAASVAACAAEPGDDGAVSVAGAIAHATLSAGKHGVALTEPNVLRELEGKGFGFGHHFGVADGARADVLSRSAVLGRIVSDIESSIDTLQREDGEAKVGTSYLHRLFDKRWLRSGISRFALVAVTNRIDRARTADCGEVRFVYRLEYADPRENPGAEKEAVWARMPMTVAVVVPQPKVGGSCKRVAAGWVALESAPEATLAAVAAAGPLRALAPVASVETNLQAVRWPAGAFADDTERSLMGGHAEYMLNVWKVEGGVAKRAPLENTPDVAAIERDGLKDELATWIRDNARDIDRGTAKLDARFLATTAFSIGPRGLARTDNRPFAKIFADKGPLAGIDFGANGLAKSPEGLLRRLDELSCQGCHQSRSLAGFHVLGEEDAGERIDQLVVGVSPHFDGELAWRAKILHALADGRDFAEGRPFAEHALAGPGRVGERCGTGADPTYADWTCGAGLTCMDVNGEGPVGACVRTGRPLAGDLCEANVVTASGSGSRTDVIRREKDLGCVREVGGVEEGVTRGTDGPVGSCSRASGGFPNGACTATCPSTPGKLRDGGAVICGRAPPTTFDDCLKGKAPFGDCMSPATWTLRAACSHDQPCRDDYACTYVPGAPAGIGQCMPPYFLFQARVDGHL